MKEELGNIKDSDSRGQYTKEQVMDAAEKLFAEIGFDGVSIRAITAEAGCNIAAVNYHFGNKENLYREVFTRFLIKLRENNLSELDKVMANDAVTLEDLIRTVCDNFMRNHEDKRFGRHQCLMRREELNPLLPGDLFFEQFRKPVFRRIVDALGQLCEGMDVAKRFLCVESMVGQLIHLCRLRMMTQKKENPIKLLPEEIGIDDFVAMTIEHIVCFSKAGIEAMERE